MIDDEMRVDKPQPGDVWEINYVPELVVLAVGKGTFEYCNQKIHHEPGVWEWDLVKFMTMPTKSLRRYVCDPVPLSEEPIDFRMHISSFSDMDAVEKHHRRMNRHLDERPEMQKIVVENLTLSYRRKEDASDDEIIAKLSDGEKEIELSLATLWELSEAAYENES